jgi:hypothetical protein
LTTRIRWLVANKKDFIIPGTDNKVLIQLLGDACGIFKNINVQGTSIVLKMIYNTSGLEQASTVHETIYQCGINSFENSALLGFFGGEATSTSTSRRSLSRSQLQCRMEAVDGVKYTFKVTFGS